VQNPVHGRLVECTEDDIMGHSAKAFFHIKFFQCHQLTSIAFTSKPHRRNTPTYTMPVKPHALKQHMGFLQTLSFNKRRSKDIRISPNNDQTHEALNVRCNTNTFSSDTLFLKSPGDESQTRTGFHQYGVRNRLGWRSSKDHDLTK